MLSSWVLVGAVVLLGPTLLKFLNRTMVRVRLQRLPLDLVTYQAEDEDAVPPSLRAGFDEPSGELRALGFVPAGYMRMSQLVPELPRRYAVFWHPVARTFATLHYRLASPPVGVAVDFVTLFEDGGWIWTLRGRSHLFVGDFASGRLVDVLDADIAERWRRHLAAITEDGRQARAAELPALCDFHTAREEEELRLGVARHEVVTTADPRRFHFTAAGARTVQRRQEEGAKRVAAFVGGGEAAFAKLPLEELERHYRMASRFEELTRGRTWPLFAISGVAFAASMGLMGSWSLIAWLIPVLLFHELGHWAAMRLLGHEAWIAFIPFIGGATISHKRFDRLSHELIVLLAGPIPGIILAFGLLFFDLVTGFHHPGLIHVAVLLLGVNVLNLVPVHPLDGGRILHALLTAGRPRLGLALKGLAAVAFILAAAALRDPTTALLAGLAVFGVWQEAKLLRVETAIRRAHGFGETTTGEARRQFIFAALRGQAEGAPSRWLASVRRLEVPLSHTKSRHWWTVLAGVAYLGAFAAGGLGLSRLGAGKADSMTCPTQQHAIALSCATPTLAPGRWESVAAPTKGRGWRRPRRASPAPFPRAAFVWCELADDQARDELLDRLEDASTRDADDSCTLPWDPPSGAVAEASSCARLWVSNVAAGLRERAAAEDPRASAGRPSPSLPPNTVRFSVRFRDLDAFAPIGGYLCALGCRVDVLPAAADDLRVDVCL